VSNINHLPLFRLVKRTLILFYLLYSVGPVIAQDTVPTRSVKSKRFAIVTAGNVLFYTGSYIALNRAWYADYERAGFHFFNDNPEWNQADKLGHVWSTYHVSRLSARLWKWTGLKHSDAAIIGGISGMVYQSIIEFQDAYSVAWGFSWGDVGANVVGAGLFVLQDIGWKDQRLIVKMGYHPYTYSPSLMNRRNDLFGNTIAERILKDYNSQTYWLSANLSSFLQNENIPSWLNVAFGYSADGMFGGRDNYWVNDDGQVYDFRNVTRARRFYLSPDIDLSRLKVKSKALKSILNVVNSLRIPLPALQVSTEGIKLKVR
jgi:hypothetical protein